MMKKEKLWGNVGFALPLLLAAVCLVMATLGSQQASLPIPMPQELIGEYSRDGQNWQPLHDEAELSAMEGDLFLRGHFLRPMQEGWELNFYRNHIGVAIAVDGEEIYRDALLVIDKRDTRLFASMCAREWMGLLVPELTPENEIEIFLHNPHRLGNEAAYRDFLTTLCAKTPGSNLLEKNLEPITRPYLLAGGLLVMVSLLVLGAAAGIRGESGGSLLRLGLMLFFFGGFLVFDTIDTSMRIDLNVFNTYARQLCLMLAVFCMGQVLCRVCSGKWGRVAKAGVFLSGCLNSLLILLCCTGVSVVFDTLPYWTVSQALLCPVLIVCCGMEILVSDKGKRLVPVSGLILCVTIMLDLAGVGAGILSGWGCTKGAFLVLFVIHAAAAARDIARNHHAMLRASRLEKELEDSRVDLMLSQIQPHFLYNVLGTIRGLCRKDPEQAWVALGDFSKYLQGNMLALKNSRLIRFDGELRHIETYLKLEKLRLGEKLEIRYDIQTTDFMLPALSVQPLVENAVKHGIFGKPQGGTVTLSTRREGKDILIVVEDNGVGFDPEMPFTASEEHTHVGLLNVRNRVKKMLGGEMLLESERGKGTRVILRLPGEFEGKEEGDHAYSGGGR